MFSHLSLIQYNMYQERFVSFHSAPYPSRTLSSHMYAAVSSDPGADGTMPKFLYK